MANLFLNAVSAKMIHENVALTNQFESPVNYDRSLGSYMDIAIL